MKAERITPFGYGLSYFTTCSLPTGDYTQYTIEEIPFPRQYRKYGHFIAGENGLIVTDG